MAEGLSEMSSVSNSLETAAENAGQSASNLSETGASEAAQGLASSLEEIGQDQGAGTALENLAFGDNSEAEKETEDQVDASSDSIEEPGIANDEELQTDDIASPEDTSTEQSDDAPEQSAEAPAQDSEEENNDEKQNENAQEGDGSSDAEKEDLLAENEALKAELAEKDAQLEAYENIRQILENLDLSVLNGKSEQSPEQRKKALGLIMAALQLMLAFFRETTREDGAKNKNSQPQNAKRAANSGQEGSMPKLENISSPKPRTAESTVANPTIKTAS